VAYSRVEPFGSERQDQRAAIALLPHLKKDARFNIEDVLPIPANKQQKSVGMGPKEAQARYEALLAQRRAGVR
jgi:hypothetical protein